MMAREFAGCTGIIPICLRLEASYLLLNGRVVSLLNANTFRESQNWLVSASQGGTSMGRCSSRMTEPDFGNCIAMIP